MANAFFVRCDCRNRRFTGGKSRFLQEADGRKGIASAADELCRSALNRNLTPSELNQHCPHTPTQRKPMASRHRLSLCPVFPNAANACKLTRKRPPLRRNKLRRSHQLKRQPLFGRGGLGERRFSQRSGLSPRISPIPLLNFHFALEVALRIASQPYKTGGLVANNKFTAG